MIDLFVPGRLCLFGEHSDWAGAMRSADVTISPGACILTGTNQGLHATAEAAPCFEISSCLPDGKRRGPHIVPMNDHALATATTARDFFSYAAGVAAEVLRRHGVSGIRINVIRTDLPVARGLSSSAAISVLTARAFNRVYRLGLDVHEEMDLAYRGELATGSQCGRMDQACAYGQRVTEIGFDGDTMNVTPLAVGRPIHLLIVDLRHEKDTRRILADLHRVFVATNDPRCTPLRAALGRRNLELIAQARQALHRGDSAELGALMMAAQELFDRDVAPACPSQLAAPRLHELLQEEIVRAESWGGKGVGSQGDGAAQLVCRDAEAQTRLVRALHARNAVDCLPLTLGAEDESSQAGNALPPARSE